MTTPGTPTLTVTDGRATIRLQRPDKRNRIEPADLASLTAHVDTIEADGTVVVVVIEAEGPSWCSGYHLGALADGERTDIGFGDVCDRIEALPMPTVAALGGNVHGGGTDLAIACDFRIAAEGIVAGMPAAKIGLQYYASGLRRFVTRIGPDATKRLFLTAETVPASELLRIGYLHEVVEPGRLRERIDELCAAIAGLAPMSVRRTKAAIDALAGPGADLALIQAGHLETVRSEDHREAMTAMRERRPPRFAGR